MTLLSIPAPLAHETILVLEAVARVLAQRQAQGLRVQQPDPSILAAAIAETIGVSDGRTIAIGYWIATENATYGRLVECAASCIEQADAIARAAELRVKPMKGAAPAPEITVKANQGFDNVVPVFRCSADALPCDTEPTPVFQSPERA